MIKHQKATVYAVDEGKSLSEIDFRVKSSFCKRFFNCLHITLKMNAKAQGLFDFLCEKMDEKNRVFVDTHLKNEFLKLITAVTSGKEKYTPRDLEDALKKLRELRLIFEVEDLKKTYYYVNPKYAFKGPQKDRLKLIQSIAQERMLKGKGVEMLVSVPLDEHYQIVKR